MQIEKFNGFETLKTQVDTLVEGTSNLENRLTQLLEANKPNSKGFKKTTLGTK